MAEDEVQYASVVVKSKKSPRATEEEDVVYDEVKISNQTAQQTPETNGPLSDKAEEKCRHHQQLACCFGILCVLLVLSIIGVCLYLATVFESTRNELNEPKSNLTRLNNKFTSVYENLKVQFNNLSVTSTALENKITTLTAENQDVRREWKNLTDLIKNMEKTWNEQNVSRAQWSIDQYCPKKNNGRMCTSCQNGWFNMFSSCYAYNNAEAPEQRNWEEAREDCTTKNSDLTVVFNQTEKDYVNEISPVSNTIKGYWIGLRAEGGKWRWIDGSDMNNQAWIQKEPVDGQCVTSLQGKGWRSVSCDEKNAWICQKKALSV